MQNKDDIFDRLMSLKFFSFARPFYINYKEMLLYVLFGGITTIISVFTFTIVYEFFSINEHVANVISWLLAVLFAFVTNRTWVFKDTLDNNSSVLVQAISFYAGRFATLVVEELIIFVFISKLNFNAVSVKVATQVIILVLNYLVSKFFVFRQRSSVSDGEFVDN